MTEPEAVLAAVVAEQRVLARTDDAAIAITGLLAYPTGFEFTVSAVLRREYRRLPPQQRLAGGRRLAAAVRRQGRRNLDVLHGIQGELAKDHIERSLVRILDAIIWYARPAAGISGVKRSIRVGLCLP